ncbi:hypothetical protein AAG570_005006 [Ranatra chinensis]|uniref:Uncharacterized protein n=1 Tax=Ranatra chinensis TaxID=642074 RepID=A0ABD0YKZ4_9HEMI
MIYQLEVLSPHAWGWWDLRDACPINRAIRDVVPFLNLLTSCLSSTPPSVRLLRVSVLCHPGGECRLFELSLGDRPRPALIWCPLAEVGLPDKGAGTGIRLAERLSYDRLGSGICHRMCPILACSLMRKLHRPTYPSGFNQSPSLNR